MSIIRLVESKQLKDMGEMSAINVRLPELILAQADELAEQIGTSRSEVIREAVIDGMRSILNEWDTAIKAKGKK